MTVAKALTNREKVIAYFKKKKKATDFDLIKDLGIDGNTIRPTRLSLLKENIILSTNVKRMVGNGGKYTVYIYNPEQPKK